MNRHEKTQTFKSNIRREQIDAFFSRKRIKLLESYESSSQNDMQIEKEEINRIDPSSMSLRQLFRVAKLVQTEAGIIIVQQAQYQQHLIKYLRQEWTGTDQQYYGTYILCNLYYSSLNCPTEHLTSSLMKLLESADVRSLENIFFLISNIINDNHQWLSFLLNQHSIGDKLLNLFGRFQHPSGQYLTHLVHLVLKIIQIGGKHTTLLQLKKPLLRVVMQSYSSERKQLIRKGVYAYYCLLKQFTQSLGPTVINYGVLEKIMGLVSLLNDRRIVNIILEMISLTLHLISPEQLAEKVLPFLIQLHEIDFQIGQQSKVFQPRDLKLESYRVIAHCLESRKLEVEHFSSTKLSEMMLYQMENSDDPDVLVELSYVFVQVSLNISNDFFKNHLRKMFARARRLNPHNYEFDVYLHEFETNMI